MHIQTKRWKFQLVSLFPVEKKNDEIKFCHVSV